MRKPLSEVVEYPRYFSYSLEKKIKPRLFIIKSRHIEYSLKEMLAKNDDEFAEEFTSFGNLLLVPNKMNNIDERKSTLKMT
jgi:mTERF domain-containing protein, mitochondrial